jgi:hypothetical protein
MLAFFWLSIGPNGKGLSGKIMTINSLRTIGE